MSKIVLVDMDNVIVDFSKQFHSVWKMTHPDKKMAHPDTWNLFELERMYPLWEKEIEDLMHLEGFFLNMKPINGAIEGIKRISEYYDTFICTSPMLSEHCIKEKIQWIQEHLGNEWLKKLIVTKDKTVIYGYYLIDDKPVVTGSLSVPNWEHIIFTQPYNSEVPKFNLLSWDQSHVDHLIRYMNY